MKTSGSNTYAAFKNNRAVLERTARGHTDAIHKSERRLQTIVERQGQLFSRLSALRINANIELPASVRASMDRRHAKIEEAKAEVEAIKDSLSSLKRQRAEAEAERASAEATLQHEHAAVTAKFDADTRVIDLRRRMAALSLAHDKLGEKKRRAQDELEQKRTAYEQDPFFTYLRNAGYGTPRYSAWLPISRVLDARLAAKTKFIEENASYERLLAVPDWWDERIATLDPEEKKTSEEFAVLEREYFHGLAPLEKDFADKTEVLRAVDAQIEDKNTDIASANQFLSNAALAEDSEIKKIAADLAAILKRTGFNDLRRLAAQSAGTEDDAIVAELQSLVDEAERLSNAVTAEKHELYDLERKIRAFSEVEDHIRRKRWNDSDHGFRNIDADRLSQQLSQDTLNAGVVIGMLNSSHVEPVRESYSGSGGSWGGSSYGGGSSSGSSSSSSNDTFTTNSSFGGSDSYTTTDSF